MDPDQTHLHATSSSIALAGLRLPMGGRLSASTRHICHLRSVMLIDSRTAGTSDIQVYMRDGYKDHGES